jgi:type IV secretory pathway TraG/TraD family ATPase VirD4
MARRLGPQDADRKVQEAHADRASPAHRPEFPGAAHVAVSDPSTCVGRKFKKPATASARKTVGYELTDFKDRELNSVLTTADRHSQFLDTQAVFDSTCASSFSPSDLLKGKMTVYQILTPDWMRSLAGLLRMWVGSML